MKSLVHVSDTEELMQRVRILRPDSVRRWGRMSAHQMVCHLTDGFRMAVGEKPVNCNSSLRRGLLIKLIALHLPLRWPEGIKTVPEVDQEIGGTSPVEFAADLAELLARIESFGSRRMAGTWPMHPIFGTMSEAEWLRWGYLHVDHHLRQFGV